MVTRDRGRVWYLRKYSLELREQATMTSIRDAGDPTHGPRVRSVWSPGTLGPSLGSTHLGVPGLGPSQDNRIATITDKAQRIKELALEVRELRRANAILRNASVCLSRRRVGAQLNLISWTFHDCQNDLTKPTAQHLLDRGVSPLSHVRTP